MEKLGDPAFIKERFCVRKEDVERYKWKGFAVVKNTDTIPSGQKTEVWKPCIRKE